MRKLAVASGAAGLMVATGAFAHSLDTPTTDAGGVLLVVLPVLLSAALYLLGLGRHRSSLTVRWRPIAFFAGLAVLAASLLPPLDTWSATSFAFHMTQHELLMLVAAPLLVLGRPLPYFLWSLPASWRGAVGNAVRGHVVRTAWRAILNPAAAWTLHAAVLWVWHAPSFFDAALRRQGVHDLQHLSFLVSALVFWAALLEERVRGRQGAGVLYLFTTTVHTSVLGALLTFATHPWYSAYVDRAPHWGLAPLEDQQIGGLIMWVPASLVYVGVALFLLARWIVATDSDSARITAASRTFR